MNWNSDDMLLFMQWVEARIDLAIEEAFGRDTLTESITEHDLRGRVRNNLGLHQHEDGSGSWEASS